MNGLIDAQRLLDWHQRNARPMYDLPRVTFTCSTEIFFNEKVIGTAYIVGYVYGNSVNGAPKIVTAIPQDKSDEVLIPGEGNFVSHSIFQQALAQAKDEPGRTEMAKAFDEWRQKHSSKEPDVSWSDIENIYAKQGNKDADK